MENQQFEFELLVPDYDRDKLLKDLNEKGKDGWRVVGMCAATGNVLPEYLLLERLRPAEPEERRSMRSR